MDEAGMVKNALTILFSLASFSALAAVPFACLPTRQECLNYNKQTGQICAVGSVRECQGYYDNYQTKETAKYKARNANQEPPARYFDYSTNTPIVVAGSQKGNINNGLLIGGGIVVVILAMVVWIRARLRK